MNTYGGVVNFTPWSLNPRGERPWYPLDRRLVRPQNQPGPPGEERILPLQGSNSEPLAVHPVASYHDKFICKIIETTVLNI
jgi:hypothetical protein